MTEWLKCGIANPDCVGSIPTRPSMKDALGRKIEVGHIVCWMKSTGGAAVKPLWGAVTEVTEKTVWFLLSPESPKNFSYKRNENKCSCSHSHRIVIIDDKSDLMMEALMQVFSWVQFFDPDGDDGHPADYVSGFDIADRLRKEVSQDDVEQYRQ